jgi:hypothetical protein
MFGVQILQIDLRVIASVFSIDQRPSGFNYDNNVVTMC